MDARPLLQRRKYEFLLAALVQHLFVAAVLPDLGFYTRVIWPINMVVLGVFSVGIFADSSSTVRWLKNVILAGVIAFPAMSFVVVPTVHLMEALSLCYTVFFLVIFVEVLRFLIRPGYINADLVSASACGYLLLLEIGIFMMQGLHYAIPGAFKGISTESFTAIYLDMVYFCSITVTSIGFGDITPAHHMSKLATSMLGIAGQFYSVVLVGILIGKYTAADTRESS